MIEDYFIIDCEHHHSFCTSCFDLKVQEKGCDHKIQCCCWLWDEQKGIYADETQLIEGALASN